VGLDELDNMAAGQHGLVTSEQAIAALGRGRKERWTAAGRLVRVQPRVYRVVGCPVTWPQRLLAAQLSSGGLVTCRAAAEMWGLRGPEGLVEIGVAARRQPRLRPPAVVHRVVDLEHARASAVERQGVMVTDPVRTIVDLGLVLSPAAVGEALDAAIGRRLLTVPDVRRLREVLSRCGRNGVGVIGGILDDRSPDPQHVESVLEATFSTLLRRHGLPEAVLQHEVWHAGRLVARVDAAYPAHRLAVELDGFEHHTSMTAFQRDRSRQNELVALGWTVLRFTWHDITRRPDHVADTIRAAIDRLSDSVCA
jgi:very-short-patch-repair endonuclease